METQDVSESLGLEMTYYLLYPHFIGKKNCISGVGKYILPLVRKTAKSHAKIDPSPAALEQLLTASKVFFFATP